MTRLILASKSASRRALMDGAGLSYQAMGSHVDEAAIKTRDLAAGHPPADIAVTLAEAKALAISAPGALIIGGDQVMEFEGRLFDKPVSIEAAKDRLLAMAGKPHHLRNGLALAQDGRIVWRHRQTATLWMRPLGGSDLDAYFDLVGDRVLSTVGGYELEGPGVRLFERIEGDYFSILGLPLLPLLAELRQRGVLPW